MPVNSTRVGFANHNISDGLESGVW
jgi:hypothetical protein